MTLIFSYELNPDYLEELKESASGGENLDNLKDYINECDTIEDIFGTVSYFKEDVESIDSGDVYFDISRRNIETLWDCLIDTMEIVFSEYSISVDGITIEKGENREMFGRENSSIYFGICCFILFQSGVITKYKRGIFWRFCIPRSKLLDVNYKYRRLII